MPGPNTISFPDFDPVTGRPTIDGFTANLDPGFQTTLTEPGFAEADTVMFGGGSMPPVVLQCERVVYDGAVGAIAPGDYLAVSAFCSFDMGFHLQDMVVLGFHPAGQGGDRTKWRRLDIHPVHDGIGAGSGGSAAEDEPDPPGLGQHLRINKERSGLQSRKGTATHWANAATPNNFHVKCASWEPSAPNTSTTAPVTLPPGNEDTFTLPVGGHTSFPPSGVVRITLAGSPVLISYTSKAAGQFLGCTRDGGTGTIPAGTIVDAAAVGWSMEVLVPRTAAFGDPAGADTWIDLDDGFGFYANVIRWGTQSGAGPHIVTGNYATQYIFPEKVGVANRLAGSLEPGTPSAGQSAMTADWFGTAKVPALQSPPGSNLGVGVRFRNLAWPESSVGARASTAAADSAPGWEIKGPGAPAGTPDNTLVAQLTNTDGANPASGVTAEFRVANWGLPPATFPAWNPASGANPANVVGMGPAGSGTQNAEVTALWPRSAVPAGYGASRHQCFWVRLNVSGSGPGVTTHFVQGGVRRNMDFVQLSEQTKEFEISGKGYDHDPEFLLFPHVRQILVPDDGRPEEGTGTADGERAVLTHVPRRGFKKAWVWIMDGALLTGDTLEIEGETARILDPSPGQFGIIATHDKPDDAFAYAIEGDGLEWTEGGALYAKVEAGGTLTGNVTWIAAPLDEVNEFEERHRPKTGGGPTPEPPGCWPLSRLIATIRSLFKK
jgi:hypothetical protein